MVRTTINLPLAQFPILLGPAWSPGKARAICEYFALQPPQWDPLATVLATSPLRVSRECNPSVFSPPVALLSLTQDTGHMAEAGLGEGSHQTLQDSNVLDLRGVFELHLP